MSELRLHGISTEEAANAFLPHFLEDFGRRFSQPPPTPALAWRAAPRDLDRVLSCRYTRTVARDNTVRLAARWAQIPPGPGGRSYAGCRVEVRELLDGRLMVFYQSVLLVTQPAAREPFVLRPRDHPSGDRQSAQRQQRRRATQLHRAVAALAQTAAAAPAASTAHTRSTPAPTHPWRTAFSRRRRQQELQGGHFH